MPKYISFVLIFVLHTTDFHYIDYTIHKVEPHVRIAMYTISFKILITLSTFVEPKMRHLNNLVIPKIAAYWKKVADALEFEVWKIKTIEKKYRNDPEDCCDELLREWLSSGLGLQPKTWSTLINALKEVKQLTAITQAIETDIQTTISSL